MTLALSLYLDECVDQRLVRLLQRKGVDVLTVQEAHTLGDDDESQLLFAAASGRLFLSHNQLHFRRLHAAFVREGRAHGGIILVPQTIPLARLEVRLELMLDWVATFAEHTSKLFTWSDLQQQLIGGYRLSTWREQEVSDALARG